jgi:hypothetical protein
MNIAPIAACLVMLGDCLPVCKPLARDGAEVSLDLATVVDRSGDIPLTKFLRLNLRRGVRPLILRPLPGGFRGGPELAF